MRGVTLCSVLSGKKKSNLGWTPLHLACYFGHKDVVEELLKVSFLFFFKKKNHFNNCMTNASDVCLQAGADVNLPNNIGDTPLHKAAFTGRKVPDCIITSSDFEFLSAFLVSLLIV